MNDQSYEHLTKKRKIVNENYNCTYSNEKDLLVRDKEHDLYMTEYSKSSVSTCSVRIV